MDVTIPIVLRDALITLLAAKLVARGVNVRREGVDPTHMSLLPLVTVGVTACAVPVTTISGTNTRTQNREFDVRLTGNFYAVEGEDIDAIAWGMAADCEVALADPGELAIKVKNLELQSVALLDEQPVTKPDGTPAIMSGSALSIRVTVLTKQGDPYTSLIGGF